MKSVYVYDTKVVDGKNVPSEWLSFHPSISEAGRVYKYSPALISYHFKKHGECLVDVQDATVIMFPVYKPEYDKVDLNEVIIKKVKWYHKMFGFLRKNK